MKQLSKTLTVMAAFALLFFAACEYEFIEPAKIAPPPPGDDTTSFSKEVLPIFSKVFYFKSCDASGCHNTGGIKPDLTPANAYNAIISGGYVNAVTPASSKLYTKCAPGGSMKKYISDEDLAILLKWLQYGAPNN